MCSATSPAGNASGQRSARIAMYCAVQSPMPGNALSASTIACTSAPPCSGSFLSSTARAMPVIAACRCRMMPSVPSASLLAAASAAGVGNNRLSSGHGVTMNSPKRSTRRCACRQPACTVTCWPSTARTASSCPSSAPGTRRPSPSGKLAFKALLMAFGSASRSKVARTRRITMGSTSRSESLTSSNNWLRPVSNVAASQPVWIFPAASMRSVRRSTGEGAFRSTHSTPGSGCAMKNCSIAATSYGGR